MSRRVPTIVKNAELVAQRRSEIIDVATRLFLERGFHKTSIRDIARACPFNLASLYMYVGSKEDILFLVAQQLMDEKAAAMAEVETLHEGPVEAFTAAFRAYCQIVHKFRPHIRLLYQELGALAPERRESVMSSLYTVIGVFEKIVRRGIEKRVFADVDPRLVALDALFMCHLWSMHTRALRPITTDYQAFSEMQSKILLQGILARKPATHRRSKKRKAKSPMA